MLRCFLHYKCPDKMYYVVRGPSTLPSRRRVPDGVCLVFPHFFARDFCCDDVFLYPCRILFRQASFLVLVLRKLVTAFVAAPHSLNVLRSRCGYLLPCCTKVERAVCQTPCQSKNVVGFLVEKDWLPDLIPGHTSPFACGPVFPLLVPTLLLSLSKCVELSASRLDGTIWRFFTLAISVCCHHGIMRFPNSHAKIGVEEGRLTYSWEGGNVTYLPPSNVSRYSIRCSNRPAATISRSTASLLGVFL